MSTASCSSATAPRLACCGGNSSGAAPACSLAGAAVAAVVERTDPTSTQPTLALGSHDLEGCDADETPYRLQVSMGEVLSQDRRLYVGILRDRTAEQQAHRALQRAKAAAGDCQPAPSPTSWRWSVTKSARPSMSSSA